MFTNVRNNLLSRFLNIASSATVVMVKCVAQLETLANSISTMYCLQSGTVINRATCCLSHLHCDATVSPGRVSYYYYYYYYSLVHTRVQATEKWSSVRLSNDSKNKVENHISVHSNLNLNGFSTSGGTERSHKTTTLGKEVINLTM